MNIDTAIQNSFAQLSSGKRINSAADDPAGLATSEGLTSQINGYAQVSDNALSAKDLAGTAEGSLSSINDSLQRMRDLAVQASSGTNSADDRKLIQNEIDQLKSSISDAAKNTDFNTIKVLDGSFSNKGVASNPSGTGRTMTIQNSSLETLGIDKFDVTQPFDISTIDNAINQVSDSRSNLGATSNSLSYEASVNDTAAENLSSSESRISDADMAKTITDLKTQQLQQQIQIYAQKTKMDQGSSVLNLLT